MPEGRFGPDETEVLVAAYERVCRTLGLGDENDPMRTVVAAKVIYLGQRGVRLQALNLVVENF
jgi:hypothetical protein